MPYSVECLSSLWGYRQQRFESFDQGTCRLPVKMRNLIIASAMLVLGLGGAILKLGPVTLSGTALSAMTGILLNLILPYENKD